MKVNRKVIGAISLSFLMMFSYSLSPAYMTRADELKVSRISGRDRIETSIKIADSFGKADNVIIATGDSYADALVASPLAHELNAPILLNRGKNPDKRVIDKVKALGASRVTIVGGENSVSSKVEETLRENGLEVSRINGSNRYDTSARIAEKYRDKTGAKKVIVASGENFPDALVSGPFASKIKAPILLSKKANLPAEVKAATDSINPDEVIAVGGVNSLNPSNIRITKRIAGNNRYDTAFLVAENMSSDKAYIASGEVFADSLVAAPLAAKTGSPILLRAKYTVQPNVENYVNSRIKTIITVGGPNTVTGGITKVAKPSAPIKAPVQKVPEQKAPVQKALTAEEKAKRLEEVQKIFQTQINAYRHTKGIAPLTWIDEAKEGSNLRAKEISEVFSHSRPDGSSYSTAFNISGQYGSGENILFIPGDIAQISPGDIANGMFEIWRHSPGHNENMLREVFTHHYLGVYEKNGRIYASDNFFAISGRSDSEDNAYDVNKNGYEDENVGEEMKSDEQFNNSVPELKKIFLEKVNEKRESMGLEPVTIFNGYDSTIEKNIIAVYNGRAANIVPAEYNTYKTPDNYGIIGGRFGDANISDEKITLSGLVYRAIDGDINVTDRNLKYVTIVAMSKNNQVRYHALFFGINPNQN